MVFRKPPSHDVRALVDALGSEDEVTCQAAAARLAVIGARAVDRLTSAYGSAAGRATRITILGVLEAIGDDRGGGPARAALLEGGDLAIAGIGVLRKLLDSTHGSTAPDALDALMTVALDSGRDRRVRLAAIDALQDQPVDVRERILERVSQEPDITLPERGRRSDETAADALWKDALDGRLPDDPQRLRDVVSSRAPDAPLSALQKLVDAVRRLEASLPSVRDRSGWRALRGNIHHALALRNSRVALYDLRETLGQTEGPLPASFLAAARAIGDAECLNALAAAFSRAPLDDRQWRHELSAAFQAVARREKVTRRHAAARRLMARWPGAAELFATPEPLSRPSRTRARSSRDART